MRPAASPPLRRNSANPLSRLRQGIAWFRWQCDCYPRASPSLGTSLNESAALSNEVSTCRGTLAAKLDFALSTGESLIAPVVQGREKGRAGCVPWAVSERIVDGVSQTRAESHLGHPLPASPTRPVRHAAVSVQALTRESGAAPLPFP